MLAMERNTVKLQGFNVDTFTCEDALDYISSNPGMVVTINPEMIRYAAGDSQFAQIVKNADLVIPDGIGIEIGLKILGHNVGRIAGIEFAKKLVERFSQMSYPIAFIGAKPEIIEKAVENLKKEIPNLNVCYIRDGYFQDEQAVLDGIKNSGAKLILAAMGSPKQEYFVKKAVTLLPDAVAIGIGGSFDVWSGVVKRAPAVFRKLGLEWLYRTIKDPKRFKRIFPTLPLFVLNVFEEKICGDKNYVK